MSTIIATELFTVTPMNEDDYSSNWNYQLHYEGHCHGTPLKSSGTLKIDSINKLAFFHGDTYYIEPKNSTDISLLSARIVEELLKYLAPDGIGCKYFFFSKTIEEELN